ncbi:hypothetical protein PG993_001219 [Apiospora rasikravindrae]|uniref:Uncharacterized protein n=1 Tax=Apiospora rasikravindrae TaxID=990691 RepID=A0ABR1UAS4_9PEZI
MQATVLSEHVRPIMACPELSPYLLVWRRAAINQRLFQPKSPGTLTRMLTNGLELGRICSRA